MQKTFLSLVPFAIAACTSDEPPSSGESEQKGKPNVLFIAVDDLRPELGTYGHDAIKSPNIDRLAEEGVQFNRAYCQVPVSGASRASLLTGMYPSRDRFVNYYTWAMKDAPEATPISAHFKKHGYYSVSNGKIFHHRSDWESSWSETPWQPQGQFWRDYQLEKNIQMAQADTASHAGPPYENADVADNAYFDGKIANKTIADLKRLKKRKEPFFLAAGFLKPHLPFNAPQKYWNKYNRDSISMPDFMKKPKNAPQEAMHNWAELRPYAGIPEKGPLSDSLAKTLIHGYRACVSYVDAQVGKLLNSLEQLGLEQNTIVILWGDHGWHLREHGLWCKHCNFEKVLHVPLIAKGPDIRKNAQTDALTGLIDVYPSLCDLCNIPVPEHAQGKSFVPILKNTDKKHKTAVYSRYYNASTIKTNRYMYTYWQNANDSIYADMLYDHKKDYTETVNISEKNENQQIVKKHRKLLKRKISEETTSKNTKDAN